MSGYHRDKGPDNGVYGFDGHKRLAAQTPRVRVEGTHLSVVEGGKSKKAFAPVQENTRARALEIELNPVQPLVNTDFGPLPSNIAAARERMGTSTIY